MNLPISMVDTSCHLSKVYKHYKTKNKNAFLGKDVYVPRSVEGLKQHVRLPLGLKRVIAVEDNPNTWCFNRHLEDPQVLVVVGCNPLNAAAWDADHVEQLKEILEHRQGFL